MLGIGFTVLVSVVLPFLLLSVAILKKRWWPFILGVLAFTISQLVIRLPVLDYISSTSTSYLLFSVLHPVAYALVLGATAALAEEGARFIAMRFFMKQRDLKAGVLFGAGHGGIEALWLVGIPIVSLLLSPSHFISNDLFWASGLERIFAIVIHIGLSVLVLQSIVHKKWRYLLIAFVIHTLVDAAVVILPLGITPAYQLVVVESVIGITAMSLLGYVFYVKRKDEKL